MRFNSPERKLSPPPGRLQRTIENAVIKILTTIIPKANPDFEGLLDRVDFWKIEFDTKANAAWREIGFDKNGVPIVAMPFGNNYGFWIDNDLTLDDYERFEAIPIIAEEFENDWVKFEKQMKSKASLKA